MDFKDKRILDSLALAAKTMKEDDILDLIEKHANKHRVIKTEESRLELMMSTQIFFLKNSIEKDGAEKALNSIIEVFNIKEGIKNIKSN